MQRLNYLNLGVEIMLGDGGSINLFNFVVLHGCSKNKKPTTSIVSSPLPIAYIVDKLEYDHWWR